MLTAPPPARTRTEPARRSPATVTIGIRRRRSVGVLLACLTASLLAAAITGAAAAWALTGAIAVLAVAYGALVARVRRMATEREMALAFGGETTFDWSSFEAELAAEAARADGPVRVPARVEIGHRDLGRFLAAYALGWLLTPVIAVIRLAGGDLSDLERHHVIERLVRAQEVGRSQSLRLLAAGMVATAGVAAVGGATVLSASPAMAATASQGSYTVHAGDTLGSIAARFGTTVAHLASVNHIADPNLIFPGQVLVVPGGSGGVTPDGTYTVRAGDTLGSIAARLGTSVAHLAALNRIADPNLIMVGEVLRVDGAAAGPSPAPSADPGGVYTVRSGDTLGSIAARFGTSVSNLARLNRLSNPNVIYVGERLDVDGSAPADPPAPAPAPAPTHGASEAAAIAARVAVEQVGKPYVYGGAGPYDFDCSGLVVYAYRAAGVSLPHYTVAQYEDTARIGESQLEPGDLVFYDNYDGPQPGHVAMYIGGGRVVSANMPGTVVQTQPLSWDGTIIGFGRVG